MLRYILLDILINIILCICIKINMNKKLCLYLYNIILNKFHHKYENNYIILN